MQWRPTDRDMRWRQAREKGREIGRRRQRRRRRRRWERSRGRRRRVEWRGGVFYGWIGSHVGEWEEVKAKFIKNRSFSPSIIFYTVDCSV